MNIPLAFDRKRVLIAGDDPTFTTYLAVLLNRMGLDIIPANSSQEALELIQTVRPNITIVSFKKIGVHWLRFLRRTQKDHRGRYIPVLAVVEPCDSKTDNSYLNLGYAGVLRKPLELAELNTMLWNVIVLPEGRRRRSLRVAYDKRIPLTHGRATEYHYAVSLSEGGIQLRQKRPLAMGTPVQIILTLNDATLLHLKGRVIDKIGIYDSLFPGVRGITVGFRDLSGENAARLRANIVQILAGDILEEQEEAYITADAYLLQGTGKASPF